MLGTLHSLTFKLPDKKAKMKSILFTLAVGALFNCAATQFNLYPPVDPALLGKLYNLGTECIQAL
jgi:hypothetical protein